MLTLRRPVSAFADSADFRASAGVSSRPEEATAAEGDPALNKAQDLQLYRKPFYVYCPCFLRTNFRLGAVNLRGLPKEGCISSDDEHDTSVSIPDEEVPGPMDEEESKRRAFALARDE